MSEDSIPRAPRPKNFEGTTMDPAEIRPRAQAAAADRLRRRIIFEACVDYAGCINTQVQAEGNAEEGVTSVCAVGPGHVGEEILDLLNDSQHDELNLELRERIAEEAGDAADRLYDELRDRRSLE